MQALEDTHAMAAPDHPAGGLVHRLMARAAGKLGAVMALGVRVGAAGLAYLLQIVLARVLGPSEYGTFNFAWTLITIGGFLATLGFAQIAVRFLAGYQEEGQFDRAIGFLLAAGLVTLAGTAITALILSALSPAIALGYGELCISVVHIGLYALPFFAFTDMMEGIARSQGWTIRALLPPYLFRQGMILALMLCATFALQKVDAIVAMKCAVIATASAALLHLVLVGPSLFKVLPKAKPEFEMRRWSAAATPTWLSDLALLARQNVDIVLLGILASPAAVGFYFAATRIASLLGLIEFAVGAAYGHRFARAQVKATESEASLAPLYGESQRLTMVPGILGALGLIVVAPYILRLFGGQFAASVDACRLLLIAMAIRLSIGPAEDALAMAGFPSVVMRANVIGALVTAILCLLLARDFHHFGAAMAAGAGILASAFILATNVRRHLGFWPIPRLKGGA